MFELTGNVRQTRDNRAPSPALRENGTNYPYRMFFDGNARIVDAEELSELIEQLIPGYLLMDEQEKKQARDALASSAAFSVKVSILGGLTSEEESSLSEWEWEVLSSDDPLEKTYPLTSAEVVEDLSDEEADAFFEKFWSSKIPLVLVQKDFYPFSSMVPPMSSLGDAKRVENIIWLDSDTEKELLDSLSRVGIISYGSPRVAPTPALR